MPATSIALFPLNIVLFPDGPLPLRIFETRYVDMVRRCMRGDLSFGVVLIREGGEVGPAQTFDVGTSARITDFDQLPGGLLGLSCVGERRFRVVKRSVQPDGLHIGEVEWLPCAPRRLASQCAAAIGRGLHRHRHAPGRCGVGGTSIGGNSAHSAAREAGISGDGRPDSALGTARPAHVSDAAAAPCAWALARVRRT